MFRNILVALKFSPAGLHAASQGVALAGVHGARLHLFHALDYRLKDLAATDSRLSESREAAQKRFDADVQPLLGTAADYVFEFFPADPSLEVCRLAKKLPSDLIILGCHQPLSKIRMGRIDYVGMTILEKAPCPVMLIPYND